MGGSRGSEDAEVLKPAFTGCRKRPAAWLEAVPFQNYSAYGIVSSNLFRLQRFQHPACPDTTRLTFVLPRG